MQNYTGSVLAAFFSVNTYGLSSCSFRGSCWCPASPQALRASSAVFPELSGVVFDGSILLKA